MSLAEQVEYLVSEQSTLDIVNDMIINAYSHLAKGNYGYVVRQLEILRAVDLDGVFENDETLIVKVNQEISKLEGWWMQLIGWGIVVIGLMVAMYFSKAIESWFKGMKKSKEEREVDFNRERLKKDVEISEAFTKGIRKGLDS